MLDEHQRAVVDHTGGPMLVLAGPGTGKTTTIVEAVVDRVERRGTDPERILILTFSRKAAEELRQRITSRMRRTTRTPLALTFHSYAYALLRREAVAAGVLSPRLLTGPEQLLEIRRLLHGELEDGAVFWPRGLHEALKTRGFAEELRDFLSRAGERGLDGSRLVALGRLYGRQDWVAVGGFADRYQQRFDLDPEPSLDYAELIREAGGLLASTDVRTRERGAYDVVFVDEYQDTDPAQELLLQQLAGEGRDLIAVGDPDQSIYGFRGADVQGILKFPERFRDRAGREAPVVALRVCRRSGADLLEATRRIATRLPAAPTPQPTPSLATSPTTTAVSPKTSSTAGDASATVDPNSPEPTAAADRPLASDEPGSVDRATTDGIDRAADERGSGRGSADVSGSGDRGAGGSGSGESDAGDQADGGATAGARVGEAGDRTAGVRAGEAGDRTAGAGVGGVGDRTAVQGWGVPERRRAHGHRELLPMPDAEPGDVKVLLADSTSQEAAVVADTLRRAHLIDGIPWHRMAVLVRSATRQVPLLRRALVTAGVPTMVAGDEVPLAQEPGVRPLLTVLRVAMDAQALDEPVAEELLTGPLGGTDMLGVRRLRRALKIAENEALLADPHDPADEPREAGEGPRGQNPEVAMAGPRDIASGPEDVASRPDDTASGPEDVASRSDDAARESEGVASGPRDDAEGSADVADTATDGSDRVLDGETVVARSSGELMIAALADVRELVRVEPHVARPAERVGNLLKAAREAVQKGGTAEDVLWEVWNASGLAKQWTDTSLQGGARGAQADRDLDAVVALFDYAAKFVDRMPKAGPEVFLDDLAAQEIPGDTLADRAPDGDAVRVLTAHRSKGLEWDVVVVAGVQEGVWPDLRLRGSMLGVEDLVQVSEGAPLEKDVAAASLSSKLLAEERRLFYVAATRARKRLVVTAVGGEDTDERPSRFLSELMPGAVEEAGVDDRARWLNMSALVADLRSAVTDPTKSGKIRQEAAKHLARLAAAGVQGAHPNDWYALTPISDDRPIGWPDDIVRISPSAVENFTKCGLRWLLETAVGAAGTSSAQGLGTIIHALAVLAATDLPSEDLLGSRLDEIWSELDFGGVWFNRKQRKVAEQMISKFVQWHKENPRELIALEEAFTARVSEGVEIRGRVDRVERDDQGRAVIIDLKTGSSKPKPGDLDRHPQLGVYQLAALLQAFAKHGMTEPGGAALVQVGKAAGKEALEQSQPALADDPDPGWAKDMVDTVAIGMSGPFFQAKVNDGCRTCAARNSCPVNDNGGQVC
ncbi:UvrD-helicase domain-containing protein [Nonomuraea sp. NPDC050556]|uniref:UvrD-helicase domain-containing protein n=1 Tax=Nonomuraea sp. NPDC050556 TaxID=3364369 RepID=UPI003787FC7A